jgi:glutamate/tyrosine decarboxylase-like PLP-dependent enzyme
MSSLDLSPDEFRRWGQTAIDSIAEYLAAVAERPLYPRTSSKEIRQQLGRELGKEGASFSELLETFNEVIVPLTRKNGHPRMFGYVQSPGAPLGVLADLLASGINANLTAWRSAPSPIDLERLTIDWLKQILGVDPGAAGLFVSGGSMANLSGLAVARVAKAGPDLKTRGTQSHPRALTLYASVEAHHSIAKAASLLGIGSDNVRQIPVDQNFKMNIDRLRDSIARDVADGHQPFCVVASAGTVATGAIDPLGEIAHVAREFGLWMHVDACYGGFARMAPSVSRLFTGLAEADSIALDPHKWLYAPMDCGCILYRNPVAARQTFAHDAEYTRVIAQEADEAFAFWDYGPELSRRFRALKVWMILKGAGTAVLSEAIEGNIACARYLEELVKASDDFEMLAPVELSIFCFRYLPRTLREKDRRGDSAIGEELNQVNERLLVALQRDGSSYLSNALIDNQFALRGCVLNYRTTTQDMEILLQDLRRVAATLE